MKLAFIGGGIMAEAILKGVLAAKLTEPEHICVGEPIFDRRKYLTEQYGVMSDDNNAHAARDAEMVLLAVKPP